MPRTPHLTIAELIAAAAVLGAPCAAQQGRAPELDLGLERPAVLWIEIPDARALEGALRVSRLGRLLERLADGIDQEQLASAYLPDRLSEQAQALRGATSSGLEGFLVELLADLGVGEEQAGELVAMLDGGLSLAVLQPREAGAIELPRDLLAGVTLREGASARLLDILLPQLERSSASGPGLERLEVLGEGSGRAALWSFHPDQDLPPGYLVVQPRRCAWTFDREVAGVWLRHGAPGLPGVPVPIAALVEARQRSRARRELALVRVEGALIGDSRLAALLDAFDFGPLAAAELGLRVDAGQIESRVRLVRAAPGDPAAPPAARTPTPWAGLELIPADTLAVVGLSTSPWRSFGTLAKLAEELDLFTDPGALAERLDALPFFAGLGAAGALQQETLFFARPVPAPGLPILYMATPQSEWLDSVFATLEEKRLAEVPLGAGLVLRQKTIAGGSQAKAWVLLQADEERRRSILSLARLESSYVVSDLSAHLSDLRRELDRERSSKREEAQAEVRTSLAAVLADAGVGPGALIGFLHVRTGPLAELCWPYVQLALQWSGAVEDPESLPEAFEIGELLGDTTSVVLELGPAVEIHARGLLGGLAILF